MSIQYQSYWDIRAAQIDKEASRILQNMRVLEFYTDLSWPMDGWQVRRLATKRVDSQLPFTVASQS